MSGIKRKFCPVLKEVIDELPLINYNTWSKLPFLDWSVVMANEMVIYKNSMNAVAFPRLNAREYDILYSVLYKVHNKGCDTVNVNFEELANLSNWQGELRVSRFADVVRSTNKKLLQANFMIALDDDAKVTSQQPLFYEFKTDENDQVLTVQVNPTFVELFNELNQNYTNLELTAVTSFESKYSKRLYAQLRQYRRSGWWQVEVAELRRLLDIPKSYSMGNLMKDAIEPAIKEIEEYTKDIISCEPIYEVRNHTRGRKPIKAFRFDFTKEVPLAKVNNQSEHEVKQEKYKCPECGEFVHWIDGKNGRFLGHDSNSKCRCTYQSVAEVKGFSETPTREDHEEVGFFSRLFGKK